MYATLNGLRLHYELEGQGIPCLTIRPIGSPILERTLSSGLRRHLQFIFFDHRGSGASSGSQDDVTFESVLDDLETLRRALGLPRVAVLGFSACGLFALEYAARHPERVSHVIGIGTGPLLGPEFDRARRTYWDSFASDERKAILRQNQERLTDEMLRSMSPSEAWIARYAALGPMYWYDATFDCSALYAGDRIEAALSDRLFGTVLPGRDVTPILPAIQAPVFLAHGRYDFAAPPTLWEGRADQLPRGEFRLFERSGHYPHYEEQEVFDASLVDWLARHPADDASSGSPEP